MSKLERKRSPAKVFSLPQTRRLSWTPIALEYTHQLVLAIWLGALVTTGFLVLPGLYRSVADPTTAAWAGLDLVMRLNFIAGGAGAFLLLTTLLMYLLALRNSTATFIQMGLLLGMTLTAILHHIAVGPKMAELIRMNPDLLNMTAIAEELTRYQGLARISLSLLALQALLGASLLFLGVRRWYRYVTPETEARRVVPFERGED